MSKCTLIKWSRKFQFEIQSQRAIELEALRERLALEIFAADPAPEKLHHAQMDEWCGNGAEMAQFSPRKVQKFESLLARPEAWVTVGNLALARHWNFQPHRRASVFFSGVF